MHRILQAEPMPERLSIDIQDIEMQNAIEQYEFEGYFIDDEPNEIKLNCSNSLLSELTFSEIHTSQQLFNNTQDTFTLTAKMPITQSFVEWLVQKSQWIEVEYPEQLREEIKYRIIEMAKNYAIEVVEDENGWQEDSVENFNEERAIQTLESTLVESEADIKPTSNEIFLQAVEFICDKETITTDELKKKLMISYNLAVKIIDEMLQLNYIKSDTKSNKYLVSL